MTTVLQRKKTSRRIYIEQKAKDAQPGGMNYSHSINIGDVDNDDPNVNVEHGNMASNSMNNNSTNMVYGA